MLVGEGVFLIFGKTQQRPFGFGQIGRFLGCDLPGIENEHLGAGGNGKGLAVGVIDGAPGGVERDIPRLVAQCLLLIKILVDNL